MVDPAAYLERIKYAGERVPEAKVLAQLQQAHLLEVPFENLYHQTLPESLFTRKKLATIFLPGGRATLTGLRLILTRGSGLRGSAEKEERELSGPNEVLDAYQKIFGMNL